MERIQRVARSRAVRLVSAVTLMWWGLADLPRAQAGDAVLVGAGDIADCGSSGDAATASLISSIRGTVFTLGDNAYGSGSTKQFKDCYGPTWGRFKARTRPAVGNHEYKTKGADDYFDYFGKAAGARGKGWYSYNAGAWHVIVLNSNCDKVRCDKGSEQERWLRADLAAHKNRCTLAYWHHARFVSDSVHGDHPDLQHFWEALYDHGAEVVLSGHAHVYERFAPQTSWGRSDPEHGIRQFVVGTGGSTLSRFRSPRPNSEVRNANTFGVLKLILNDGGYDWNFIPKTGKNFRDSGHASCHGRP